MDPKASESELQASKTFVTELIETNERLRKWVNNLQTAPERPEHVARLHQRIKKLEDSLVLSQQRADRLAEEVRLSADAKEKRKEKEPISLVLPPSIQEQTALAAWCTLERKLTSKNWPQVLETAATEARRSHHCVTCSQLVMIGYSCGRHKYLPDEEVLRQLPKQVDVPSKTPSESQMAAVSSSCTSHLINMLHQSTSSIGAHRRLYLCVDCLTAWVTSQVRGCRYAPWPLPCPFRTMKVDKYQSSGGCDRRMDPDQLERLLSAGREHGVHRTTLVTDWNMWAPAQPIEQLRTVIQSHLSWLDVAKRRDAFENEVQQCGGCTGWILVAYDETTGCLPLRAWCKRCGVFTCTGCNKSAMLDATSHDKCGDDRHRQPRGLAALASETILGPVSRNQSLLAALRTPRRFTRQQVEAWPRFIEALVNSVYAACPMCGFKASRDDKCTHMTCTSCGIQFCYCCRGVYVGDLVEFERWQKDDVMRSKLATLWWEDQKGLMHEFGGRHGTPPLLLTEADYHATHLSMHHLLFDQRAGQAFTIPPSLRHGICPLHLHQVREYVATFQFSDCADLCRVLADADRLRVEDARAQAKKNNVVLTEKDVAALSGVAKGDNYDSQALTVAIDGSHLVQAIQYWTARLGNEFISYALRTSALYTTPGRYPRLDSFPALQCGAAMSIRDLVRLLP